MSDVVVPEVFNMSRGELAPAGLAEQDKREKYTISPLKLLEAFLGDKVGSDPIQLKCGGVVTEKSAVGNIVDFLNLVVKVASRDGEDSDMSKGAVYLLNKLIFIGGKELEVALAGMAGWLAELAKEFEAVYVVPVGVRSERYMCLRVLNEFDRGYGSGGMAGRVRFDETGVLAAKEVASKPINAKLKLLVVDDFAVSGVRAAGFHGHLVNELIKAGVAESRAREMVEVWVVVNSMLPVEKGELKLRSFYKVEPGTPVTGAHVSVDYRFKHELMKMADWMSRNGYSVELPWLCKILPPYEFEGMSGMVYRDSSLQLLAQSMISKYGMG